MYLYPLGAYLPLRAANAKRRDVLASDWLEVARACLSRDEYLGLRSYHLLDLSLAFHSTDTMHSAPQFPSFYSLHARLRMKAVAGNRVRGTRPASKHVGVDKENLLHKKTTAPQKHKKPRDINGGGIFGYAQCMGEKRRNADEARSILSPKFAGIGRPPVGKTGFFTRLHEEARARDSAEKGASSPDMDKVSRHARRHEQKQKALSCGIAGIIKPYMEGIATSWTTKLKDQHRQREAVRLDIDYKTGRPLNKPGFASTEDFARLAKRIQDLDQPFPDSRVTLHFRNPGGDVSINHVRVGDLKDNILKQLKAQEAKHQQLKQDLDAIDEEIAGLRQEINDDASDRKKAAKEFEKQMKIFEKEKKEIEALAETERAEFRDEQKRTTAVLNQKIHELFAGI